MRRGSRGAADLGSGRARPEGTSVLRDDFGPGTVFGFRGRGVSALRALADR